MGNKNSIWIMSSLSKNKPILKEPKWTFSMSTVVTCKNAKTKTNDMGQYFSGRRDHEIAEYVFQKSSCLVDSELSVLSLNLISVPLIRSLCPAVSKWAKKPPSLWSSFS